MKICIASKDRSSNMSTPMFFKPKDVLIFVEPQEVRRYKTYWPDYEIIDIKKSDQGICYVRNFIVDYVDDEKIIMADDDIISFGIRNDEYRYDDLRDIDKMLKDIEEGLDRFTTYTIPFSAFAYFENKSNNNKKRYYINEKISRVFYGMNLKTIREKKIRYDNSLDAEDLDFCMQVILNNCDICTDYEYLLKAPVFSSGGLSSARKNNSLTLDGIVRHQIKQITDKYGAEFISISHDSKGYAHSCTINFDLVKKRKEIVRKNIEEYFKKKKLVSETIF